MQSNFKPQPDQVNTLKRICIIHINVFTLYNLRIINKMCYINADTLYKR